MKSNGYLHTMATGKSNFIHLTRLLVRQQINRHPNKGGRHRAPGFVTGLSEPQIEGGQAEPIPSGKLPLCQTALVKFREKFSPFAGSALPASLWSRIHPPTLTPAILADRRPSPDGYSELVRAHGLRHARYRGLTKVRLQNYQTGAVCNLKRWIRRNAWELAQATRRSSPPSAPATAR